MRCPRQSGAVAGLGAGHRWWFGALGPGPGYVGAAEGALDSREPRWPVVGGWWSAYPVRSRRTRWWCRAQNSNFWNILLVSCF